jgi:hypothetical protein
MVEMSALLFHHACDLANVHHGVLRGERRARRRGVLFEPGSRGDPGHLDLDVRIDLTFDAAYAWAAERVGFWPLFVAVGGDDADRRMTGYQDQWRRWRATDGEETRPPSRVLFSWRDAPPATVFMDFAAWHIVLNSVEFPREDLGDPRVRQLAPSYERQIWKHSWQASDWLRMARRGQVSVQAVVPELDLRTADELWCRNQACAHQLVDAGFDPSRVVVRRLQRKPWR